MKLTSYTTRSTIEVPADEIIEFHDRHAYREVTTGVSGICETRYKVTESVPQIMDKIREEKTS